MNVFFDVLATLVAENVTPRPYSREVFLELSGMGHDAYLWSSGGHGGTPREPPGSWASRTWSKGVAPSGTHQRASPWITRWTTTRGWWRSTAVKWSRSTGAILGTRNSLGWWKD